MVNNLDRTVSVIDGVENMVMDTIIVVDDPGDDVPAGVAVNPSTNRIYVTKTALSFAGGTVSVIDGAENMVIGTITVGVDPLGVAVNPITNRIYVANRGDNTVSVIDGFSNTVITTLGVGEGPAGVAVNPVTCLIFVANEFSDDLTIIQDVALSIITTVAGRGAGVSEFGGDEGPATGARLNEPRGVFVGSTGDIFIADTLNSRVRKVDGATGIITTVAGGNASGFSGDNGTATSARLGDPMGVFVDSSDNIFIADGHGRIRKVDGETGIIITVAGNDDGFGFSGDGGPATEASLFNPSGVSVDSAGNIFIADTSNGRIRKVDTSGIITTVAEVLHPTGIFIDSSDNIFFAIAGGDIFKMDTSGNITTVVGSEAGLFLPLGIFVDSLGNIFIADTGNDRIRRVDTSGNITTVAGNDDKTSGFRGDGGPATEALLSEPGGVFGDSSGNIFIADTFNNRIRKVSLCTAATPPADDGGDEGDDGGDSDGIFGCSSVGIPQTKAMSKLMNKLRERIESNRFAGQQYIELYYKNIKELTQIVNSHPALASRLVSERTRLMPSILLLIFGEHAVFSKTDVKRIELILDAIHAYASPQLGNR